MMEHLFNCAICQRDIVDYRNRNGRDRHLPPVCRLCEGYWSNRGPASGAFMDRRIAEQISALANALGGEAHGKQWGARYGRA